MTSDLGGTGDNGFLRDMTAQSARAHAFDRRMRWFWLRVLLTGRGERDEELRSSAALPAPRRPG